MNKKTNALMSGITSKANTMSLYGDMVSNAKRIVKLTAVGTVGIALLTACGSQPEPESNYADRNLSSEPESNYDSNLPPVPDDTTCGDWEWNEEYQVWECDDYDDGSGSRSHVFFYGGTYFKNSNSLLSNSSYKSYKGSSSFKSYGTKNSSVNSSTAGTSKNSVTTDTKNNSVNSSTAGTSKNSVTTDSKNSSVSPATNGTSKSAVTSGNSGVGGKASGFGG